MKKVFLIILLLYSLLAALCGCSKDKQPVINEYKEAYLNCIEYIKNSNFSTKDEIDINIVTISTLTDKTSEVVKIEEGKKSLLDLSDWVFTIGDTSDHNFVRIVCDSKTYEVIGFIPIA